MSRVYEVSIFKSTLTGDWRAVVYNDRGLTILDKSYLTRWGATRAAKKAVRKHQKPSKSKDLYYEIEVD